MNKADRIFKENLTEILESGYSTEGHKIRPVYKDVDTDRKSVV